MNNSGRGATPSATNVGGALSRHTESLCSVVVLHVVGEHIGPGHSAATMVTSVKTVVGTSLALEKGPKEDRKRDG